MRTLALPSDRLMGCVRRPSCAPPTTVIAMPNLSHDVDFFPGQRQGWGLSFLINIERSAEGRSPGSLSWGGLANTYFWIDPAANIGGLMMTQVIPFADPEILHAFKAFEQAIYEELTSTKAA
jgi:methyl acetate hydrolase